MPSWSVIYCGVQLLKPGTLINASQELFVFAEAILCFVGIKAEAWLT